MAKSKIHEWDHTAEALAKAVDLNDSIRGMETGWGDHQTMGMRGGAYPNGGKYIKAIRDQCQ